MGYFGFRWFVVCALGLFSNYTSASPPSVKNVTVTLFQWPFEAIAAECPKLASLGYGYVETSPVHEHVQGSQWWVSYQPVSYRIAGRLGGEEAFKKMIARCHQAGIKIIVDVVLNHMTKGGGLGTGGSVYSKYDYPGTYQVQDFHWCHSPIYDYRDRDNVQNCELDSLADLDTASHYVRSKLAAFLNHLISLQVDGFRIDAAKHISAADVEAIKAKLNKNVFWVQEVIYGEGEAVQPEEYLHLGDIDEFRYGRDLKRVFNNEKLHYLANFGEGWGYLASQKARVFIDNWDTERNGSTLNYKDGQNYILANIFMLSYPYGSPNVYSGYQFSNADSGSPEARPCFNNWLCQHRWRALANMVAFYNAVQGQPLTNWWSNNNNAIAFGRGSKGFVIINHENKTLSATFQTSLWPGVYCDIIHGDITDGGKCTGPSYQVDANGTLTAFVNANDALALYSS
ncbi:glycosidase [Legionella jordanis]|nr:glycosidase [Legionella jordanis]